MTNSSCEVRQIVWDVISRARITEQAGPLYKQNTAAVPFKIELFIFLPVLEAARFDHPHHRAEKNAVFHSALKRSKVCRSVQCLGVVGCLACPGDT